jgi:membrane protease YdiL (CAAX protease family)
MSSAAVPLSAPFAESDYWRESARPLVSLALVGPLIVLYEAAVLVLETETLRGGADFWLRRVLAHTGLDHPLLLPLAVCGLLLAWHHARRDPWRVELGVVARMGLEATAYGAALALVGQLVLWTNGQAPPSAGLVREVALSPASASPLGALVGCLGAGIYEELLFRLLLLPPCVAAARAAGLNRWASLLAAIAATSLIFAAAHYRAAAELMAPSADLVAGEVFDAASFAFRTAAGALFAALFAQRGFGIAVGAHVVYDALLVLV